jgi:hypothetical protein
MSTPMGFRYLYDAGYIDREIDMWFHVGRSSRTTYHSNLRSISLLGTQHLLCGTSGGVSHKNIFLRHIRGR